MRTDRIATAAEDRRGSRRAAMASGRAWHGPPRSPGGLPAPRRSRFGRATRGPATCRFAPVVLGCRRARKGNPRTNRHHAARKTMCLVSLPTLAKEGLSEAQGQLAKILLHSLSWKRRSTGGVCSCCLRLVLAACRKETLLFLPLAARKPQLNILLIGSYRFEDATILSNRPTASQKYKHPLFDRRQATETRNKKTPHVARKDWPASRLCSLRHEGNIA